MLDIGWIFQGDLEFCELICILSKSPHYKTLFSTDLVLSLVEIFQKRYRNTILIRCTIPFMVYLAFTVCFFTIFTSTGINSYSDEEQVIARFMGFIIICFDLYFLFFEFVSIMRDVTTYLTTDLLFNISDMVSTPLNILLVYLTLTETEANGLSDRSLIKTMASFGVLMMWIKFAYWMTFFFEFSYILRLVKATLYDIVPIMYGLICTMAVLGNALEILNEGRY